MQANPETGEIAPPKTGTPDPAALASMNKPKPEKVPVKPFKPPIPDDPKPWASTSSLIHKEDDDSISARIDTVEKSSSGSIPTDMSLGIAQSNVPKDQLGHAARLFARAYDVPLSYYLKPFGTDTGLWTDPRTGLPMTTAYANTIGKPYEVKAVEAMIRRSTITHDVATRGGKSVSQRIKVDPEKLVGAYRIISRYVDTSQLDFKDAFSLSIGMSQTLGGWQWGTLERNLGIISKTMGNLSPKEQVQLAHYTALLQHPLVGDGDEFVYLAAMQGRSNKEINQIADEIDKARQIYEQGNLGVTAGPSAGQTVAGRGVNFNPAPAPDTTLYTQEPAGGAGIPGMYGSGGLQTVEGPGYKALPDNMKLALDMVTGRVKGDQAYGFAFNQLSDAPGQATTAFLPNFMRDEAAKLSVGGRMAHVAWDDSLLGRTVFKWIGDGFNWVYKGINFATYEAGVGLGAATALLNGVPLQDVNAEVDYRKQARLRPIIEGKETLAGAMEEDGYPSYFAIPAEIVMQTVLDPTVYVGKAFTAAHKALSIPEMIKRAGSAEQGAADVTRAVAEFMWRPQRALGKKSFIDFLFLSARESKDDLSMFDRVTGIFKSYYMKQGVSASFLDISYRTINEMMARGASESEIKRLISDFFIGNFGVNLKGSKAEILMQELENSKGYRQAGALGAAVASATHPNVYQPWELDPQAGRVQDLIAKAFDDMDVVGAKGVYYYDVGATEPMRIGAGLGEAKMMEIPHFSVYSRLSKGGYNLGNRIASVLPEGMRREWAALGSKLPSTVMNLEHDYADSVRQFMSRSGVFSEKEVATMYHAALDLARPGTTRREGRFVNQLRGIEKSMIERQAAKLGVKGKDAQRVVEDYMEQSRQLQASMFGVDEEGLQKRLAAMDKAGGADASELGLPDVQWETQLPNQWILLDPVKVHSALAKVVGFKGELSTMTARAFGKSVPKQVVNEITSKMIADNWIKWAGDSFLRVWKPMTIVSPRYMLRVPMGDEQLRYIADLGLMSRIEDSRMAARVAHRFGGGRIAGMLGLNPESFYWGVRNEELDVVKQAVRKAGFADANEAMDAIRIERKFGKTTPDVDQQLKNLDANTRKILENTIDNDTRNIVDINPEWDRIFAPNPTSVTEGDAHGLTYGDSQYPRVAGDRRTRWSRNQVMYINEDPEAWKRTGPLAWDPNRSAESTFGISDAQAAKGGQEQLNIRHQFVVDHEQGHVAWDSVGTGADAAEMAATPEGQRALRRVSVQSRVRNPDGTITNKTTVMDLSGGARGADQSKAADAAIHEVFSDGWSLFKNNPDWLEKNAPDLFNYMKKNEARIEGAIRSKKVRVVYLHKEMNPNELVVRFTRPRAGDIMDERGVNSGSASDFFRTLQNDRRGLLHAMARQEKSGAHYYGLVRPGDKDYYATLEKVLRMDVGNSSLGRRILAGIRDGRSPAEIQADLENFINNDRLGREVAGRLGIGGRGSTPQDVADHIEGLERQVRTWTNNDPAIADAILRNDRGLTPMLQNIPKENLHDVHGFMIGSVTGDVNPAAAAWNFYARWIFEMPTNRLSRQPYFKAWYKRASESMQDMARGQGLSLSEDLLTGIDAASRDFAVNRTLQIMFDFRKSNRFAELARFVAPFMQPYLEAFTVWGHLIKQNPGFAAHVRLLHKWATENNLIRTDPISGDQTFPMSAVFFGGPLLNMAFGGAEGLPGWSLSGPLSSLNFVFGSMLNVPTGKLAGDVPLPVPSLSPPVMWLMQKWAKSNFVPEGMKYELVNWAFQYGSLQGPANLAQGLLPSYLSHLVDGFTDNDVVKSSADDFLKLYQARGITPKSYAKAHGITVAAAEERIAAQAMSDAKHLQTWRAFYSWIMPVAPSISFPTVELEKEFRDTVAANGWEIGRNIFLKKYPQYDYITIGSTLWNREGIEVPIPANEAVDRLLGQPGVEEFAHEHPRWFFALIPKEYWGKPFDRQVFFKQMDEGWRTTKDPLTFMQDADKQNGWEAWRSARNIYDSQIDWLRQQNISTTSVTALAYKRDYDEVVGSIKQLYPGFASDINTMEQQGVDPKVMHEARNMLKIPMFAKTEVGKGLAEYFVLRASVAKQLSALNITSLKTVSAAEAGLTETYQKGVDGILKQYPDFERAYSYYFRNDLQNVLTQGDKLIDALTPEQRDAFREWDTRWADYRHQATQAIDSADASMAYINQRDMSNQTFAAYPELEQNPQYIWWNTLDPQEKDQYKGSVAARPYVFLSRFDRQVVLGEQTDQRTEDQWMEIGKMSAAIAQTQKLLPGESVSNLYDLMNAKADEFAASNSYFATQLEHANTWGYTFQHTFDFTSAPGAEGAAWGAFFESLSTLQTVADAAGLTGTGDPDPTRRGQYLTLRYKLEEEVQALKDYSPQFADDWERFEERPGYLISSFMPDNYYRLGSN